MYPIPPGIGDMIDLSCWANIEEFEDEDFDFEGILVVQERFWYKDKKTTEVVLQLWCECEE